MHQELQSLFETDQAERKQHPEFGTPAYKQLRENDAKRRQRVTELIAQGALQAPEDFYHAAMIFQHGETLDDIWQAHELAQKSASLGFARARWLIAASLDRWLMYQGKPQKYGTQFTSNGTRYRLWDVDPATTDAERQEYNVPSLQQQYERAKRLTREEKQHQSRKRPDG
uniref:Uncharacterized protein n=1 Tax=Thermosporothrix sp. COM3 TaxID=2490863 RepID=A0A455SHA6_9CHLR|nr:hypothetical protein KTC_26080 [Thermosporothrix sp. COM3]